MPHSIEADLSCPPPSGPTPTRRGALLGAGGALLIPAIAGCSPTVRLEAPREPIEINLNIRIEQEVRIKVDRELESLFEEEDDIF
ncbi:MAG: YnbE family lipoprotein [Inquilinus sp.]|nr:YnbE family lipoprotein [Inquilinus sp.]